MKERNFKASNGRWKTEMLFFEKTTPQERDECYFTLKEQDHQGYLSLYRLYMEEQDIHEVNFAKRHLGGYSHWKLLCSCEWFKPYIEAWREELELILMSKGLTVLKEALGSDKLSDAAFAARYFANRGWDEGIHKNSTVNASRGRGRPSKKGLQDKLTNPLDSTVQEDFKRLFKN